MNYEKFIEDKTQLSGKFGFSPVFMPDMAFDFQKMLIEWSVEKGRSAVFADCGLGKTLTQLAWAQNVVEHTNKNVLILTPLAVSFQTINEAEKFGIDARRCNDGKVEPGAHIVATNYERLHYFDKDDFIGVVCDESSILKNFDGVIKQQITDFMRKKPYRHLCTATAAPNDYIELGTSSEALGELGYIAMLQKFFKASDGSYAQGGGGQQRTRFSGANSFGGKFRFRGHSEKDFWRWVCSWARAIRKPSDCGCSDDGFILPELITNQHVVKAKTKNPEFLFDMPAHGLAEQRHERSRTVQERCEMAAELVKGNESAVVWCNLNGEGDLLNSLIPDAVQVAGKDSDEVKEERFRAFESGQARVMITKPTIAGFGLNWQHCAHQTYFPSHSFEQWYQAVRRSWRFGQKNKVVIDVISSEGEADILKNLQRKSNAADVMFDSLVKMMHQELVIKEENKATKKERLPKWL